MPSTFLVALTLFFEVGSLTELQLGDDWPASPQDNPGSASKC